MSHFTQVKTVIRSNSHFDRSVPHELLDKVLPLRYNSMGDPQATRRRPWPIRFESTKRT
jgi:hypothetical protein